MLPTYTTNITGLRHWCCGSSFTKESTSACWKMLFVTSVRGSAGVGDSAGAPTWVLIRKNSVKCRSVPRLSSAVQRQVLDDRAERQGREEGEGTDDDDDTDQHGHEQRRMCRQRAQADRHFLLCHQRASDSEHRNG